TLTGAGVAPVQSTSHSNAGNVLVGTSGSAVVTVTNTGDGNLSGLGAASNLNGTAGPGGGDFSRVGTGSVSVVDNGSATVTYTYTPGTRGADSQSITVAYTNGNSDNTNAAQNVVQNLTGAGVAPVQSTTHSNAGNVLVGTSGS